MVSLTLIHVYNTCVIWLGDRDLASITSLYWCCAALGPQREREVVVTEFKTTKISFESFFQLFTIISTSEIAFIQYLSSSDARVGYVWDIFFPL